ncbi:MAG TPA: redoxin domain-containing protein [Chloroflexia bacterium]|nr:redoxin domain-containing protein [Chloroflexia bacterium]
MNKTDITKAPPNPGFEVEITSGGRAHDGGQTPRVALTLSPARAAAKARARRRTTLVIVASALLFGAIILWAWLSNPNTLVPSDAVTRVNGEYIYERDITREMDLERAVKDLGKPATVTTPTAALALENLISRLVQVQDAEKAGVVISEADIENALATFSSQFRLSTEQFSVVLSRYNCTLADMRASLRDALLISRHISQNVAISGKTADEKRAITNEWQTRVSQSARIDRLKPAGSGPAPRVGSEAPDFTLTDIDGNEVQLSALRGRPVMINFWATWCPPCRSEIPDIVKLYKTTHKEGSYEILGIATQSDNRTIKSFAQEFGMTFPILPDVDSRTTSLYHVLPIPTSFFIDKEGIIRDVHIGVVDSTTMEKWLLAK